MTLLWRFLLLTPSTKTEDGGLPRSQELVPGRAADDRLMALLGVNGIPERMDGVVDR